MNIHFCISTRYLTYLRLAVKSVLVTLILVFSVMNAQAGSLSIGDKAPSFVAKTITGKEVRLTDFIDKKPVYLKFWATWCSYCKVEMPHLQEIYDENGEAIEVLTINVGMNDSIKNIESFFGYNGFNLPTIFDQKGRITSSYGVVGTPFHVLIDKYGKVVYQTFLATDQLDKEIEELSNGLKTATVEIYAKGVK